MAADTTMRILVVDDFEVGGGNFLVSKDPWFRPVSTQTGPDGALWVMDWYDRYPCYQNAQADPAGVDREHGRIWQIGRAHV